MYLPASTHTVIGVPRYARNVLTPSQTLEIFHEVPAILRAQCFGAIEMPGIAVAAPKCVKRKSLVAAGPKAHFGGIKLARSYLESIRAVLAAFGIIGTFLRQQEIVKSGHRTVVQIRRGSPDAV